VKAITAITSVATALVLWPTIPKALQVPGPELLRRKNDELRRYTHELTRSNEDLDSYAHVVSHDLKSPLRAIDYLAVCIAEDKKNVLSDRSREDLETMRQRVRRMSMLLDGMLEYSRIGKTADRIERFDTAEMVRDILALQGFSESFHVEVGEHMPVMVTAKMPFEMVMRNLIDNAYKHRQGPEGHVWISARLQDRQTEFCVRDDGPGIDPAYHAQIFNLFTTLQPAGNEALNGWGLALVKRAVEQQGGTVRVESEVGRGAAFYFTWPNTPEHLPKSVVA
jgi:light-regulated signal transduction histidine kinase (bacteriophytochrome)